MQQFSSPYLIQLYLHMHDIELSSQKTIKQWSSGGVGNRTVHFFGDMFVFETFEWRHYVYVIH